MAQSLSQLFFEATGKKAGEQTALTASGSNRRYYRIESEDKSVSLIGVQGTSREENHAFLYMAELFLEKGHERIAFIGESLTESKNLLFKKSMEKNGVKVKNEYIMEVITAKLYF